MNDLVIHTAVKNLKKDQRTIHVEDYGAGSKINNQSERKISSIVKTATIQRKYGKLLARLIERYDIKYAIELGTSLGVGAMYLAQPGVNKLITIEGSPQIANYAQQLLLQMNYKNVEVMTGKFDEVLPTLPAKIPRIDLVFIDGNHRYQPTIDYFNFFVDLLDENAFIIFDDIHWSTEMEKAWTEICQSEKIHVSMDLYRLGIVCKRPHQAKQHFVIKY